MNLYTDDELVQKVKQGDSRAFDLIVLKYNSRIERCIFKLVKDTEATKDLTQDTFLNAYNAMHNFRGDSKLYTWLYSIARNASMNYLTSETKKRKIFLSIDLNNSDAGETHDIKFKNHIDELSPETYMLCDELVANINNTISGLNSRMRDTFLLRCEEEMSYEDIATTLNIPLGTAKSRVSKVRDAIDKNLDMDNDRIRNRSSKAK